MKQLQLLVLTPLIFGFIQNADALLISTSQALNFSSDKQSLWGPGVPAASFQASGRVGTSKLGVSYEFKASTGTVERAAFNGALNYSYNDYVEIHAIDKLSIEFMGDYKGGLIDTLFGLSLDTNWLFAGETGCIYCIGKSLDIDHTFTPKLDTAFSGSDSTTIASAGIDIGVLAAGVNGNISQTSTFEATDISGTVTAINQSTGTTKITNMDITNNGLVTMDLGLDEVGIWDVSFTSIKLNNSFFSSFTADLVPFIDVVGLAPKEWNIASIGIGQTDSFSLDFSALNLNPFTIQTYYDLAAFDPRIDLQGPGSGSGANPTSVSEPPVLALMCLGLIGFNLRRHL